MNFWDRIIYHNSLIDWLISIAIIVATILLARIIYWVLSKTMHQFTRQTETGLDDLIIKRIDTPVVLAIVLIGFRFSIERLTFPRSIDNYLQRGFVFMITLTITWFLTRVVRSLIEHWFKQYKEAEGGKADEQMALVAKRASLIILWSLGFIVGLNNAGFDVGALIAGLGIGGLAIALAAQDTVKNIIGGLIVFIDKPFHIGDAIRIKEFEGTVVYTGIRSTRIRTAAGRIITLPNAQFTDNAIENITREPSRRVVVELWLHGETPVEKVEEGRTILKNITDTSEFLINGEAEVYLERIYPSALEVKFIYFISKGYNFAQSQDAVNRQILQRFKAAGIRFADPAQVTYQRSLG